MKVKDLMRTRNLLTVRSDDDVALAGQLMRWGQVRHLPVLDGDAVVGVFTERDLLRYRAETGGLGGLAPVSRFMSAPPDVVGPEDDAAVALGLMVTGRRGCLPVVDEHRLVGLLTVTDLLDRDFALAARRSRTAGGPSARTAMTHVPVSVGPRQPLLEAIGWMLDYGIRHLPVVEDGQVVGILSDRDIRTAVGDPREALEQEREGVAAIEVGSVMTRDVLLVDPDANLAELAQKFLDSRVGALPVVDPQGALLGIVSYLDLIRTWHEASASPGA